MRTSGNLAIVLSISVFAAACGQSRKSDPLAALDEAYQSGVLTRAEYDAKKAALQAPGRLQALDEAYRSGVLTKAEYDAKRSALLAVGQQPATVGPKAAAASEPASPKPEIPPPVPSPVPPAATAPE